MNTSNGISFNTKGLDPLPPFPRKLHAAEQDRTRPNGTNRHTGSTFRIALARTPAWAPLGHLSCSLAHGAPVAPPTLKRGR